MNLPWKFILLFFILCFTGTGVYLGAIKLPSSYKDTIKQPVQKQISVKPGNIREKQLEIDSWSIDHDKYTFFDTLDDASMSKFIGLSEVGSGPKKIANEKTPNRGTKNNQKHINSPINKNSYEFSNSIVSGIDEKKKYVLGSGFVLQVGSFKTLERANLLKNNLSKKGYPTFITTAQISDQGETWHRVIVGEYEKEIAVRVAIIIKNKENIDSIIIERESLSFSEN